MRVLRAIPLDKFSFSPSVADPRQPWARLADYVSRHAGREVSIAQVAVYPGTWAKMLAACRVHVMLAGLPREAAYDLPAGQVLRTGGLVPGLAYVVEVQP